MIRTIKSGKVVEKSKFWVSEATRPRAWKHRKMTRRKKDENERQATKVLARELNCNCTRGDVLLTLDYAEAPTASEAAKTARNFIRRLKRAAGQHIRWWLVTADRNGKTGLPVRVHHHLVISGGAFSFSGGAWYAGTRPLAELWTAGNYNVRTLSGQPDYTQVAVYLIRQARAEENEKKWTCSRNLLQPEVRESVVMQAGPLRPPAGALLLAEGEYDCECGSHYIRYVPDDRRRTGRGRTDGKEGQDEHQADPERRPAG